ncbi:MAG: ABC transporter substrate-binding protein [Pseudomonadota bacterium]|nr:ABC transporter substrate-binding protein [Pseudomonadota bacterium]
MPRIKTAGFILACLIYATPFCSAQAEATPSRVISAAGGLTEVIYALSEQNRLVAVDTSSFYPEPAKLLPNIGYMRALSPEGVLSMRPDLLLTTSDVGPKPVLELIQQAGVPIHQVNSDKTIDGVIKRITTIGTLLDSQERSSQLAAKITKEYRSFIEYRDERLSKLSRQPRAVFLLAHEGHMVLSAGQGTAADAMIKLAGAKNVSGPYHGYKPLSREALTVISPDVIITTTQSIEHMSSKAALLKSIGFTDETQPTVIVMDAGFLMNFGPRTVKAASSLFDQIIYLLHLDNNPLSLK